MHTKAQWTQLFRSDYYRRFSEGEPWDAIQEACGIFGVYAPRRIDTFSLAQFGMFALQHRGQEACGLSVARDGKIHTFKREGLVLDAFKSITHIDQFQGNAAIGHTRYTTSGDSRTVNFQPLYAQDDRGEPLLSIVQNGNLVNDQALRTALEREGIGFLATSDAEVILRLMQKQLSKGIEQAVRRTTQAIRGAYSVLALTPDSLLAFRDPNGIRPLCMGELGADTRVFSSETCGLDAVGATYTRDLEPGELVIVDAQGLRSIRYADRPRHRICSFEYIYFARPDSRIENRDVYELRVRAGEELFEQSPVAADVVVGVPDSGVPSAIGYAKASGIPFRPILVKNRYMSRSFIVPTQEMRERVVDLKLNPIPSQVSGKRMVVLDDSIVRGTTSKRLVKMLREAGAEEIHLRSASPPIVAPCFLGIDTPDKKALISARMDKGELATYLGVDSLDFLRMESLVEMLGSPNHCFGCFTERYPVSPDEKKID